jgi:hypothetical protein
VLGDDSPERSGVRRTYRLSFIKYGRCADQQWCVDDVGVADDPAHVGGRPPHVTRTDVVDGAHRPGQRDRVTAVVANHSLRLPRRTRGVEDVQRVGRCHRNRVGGFRGGGEFVPVQVAVAEFRERGFALEHDCVVGLVLGELEGSVDDRLVLDHAGRLDPARGGDDDPRGGVVDPGRELLRRKAAEYHGVDRAQPGAREHGDDGFRHHRHIDDDTIALADTK